MNKPTLNFINWAHLKCFNVFNVFFFFFFSTSVMGLLTSSLMGILKEKNAITEVKATSMNLVKGKIITKCVILMSMTYLQFSIKI